VEKLNKQHSVKEGSTFHWDFHTHQWLENTKANQALGANLDAQFKEQRRQKLNPQVYLYMIW